MKCLHDPKSKSSIQATRLTQLFDQGVHNLSRALKTARGFERQKLGKREQRAKKEKDEKLLGRTGEEIGALKVCLFFFSEWIFVLLSVMLYYIPPGNPS